MAKPTQTQTDNLNEKLHDVEKAFTSAVLYSNQAGSSMASTERKFIASWLFGRAVSSVFLSMDSGELSNSASIELAEIMDARHSENCNVLVSPYVYTCADSFSCPCNVADLDDVDVYGCLLQDLADVEDPNDKGVQPFKRLADCLVPVADFLVAITILEGDPQAQETAQRIRRLVGA